MFLLADLSLNLSLGLISSLFPISEPFALFRLSLLLSQLSQFVLGVLQLLSQLIQSLFLLVLLSQLGPELHAWHSQGEEQWVDGRRGLSWGCRWDLWGWQLELF